MVQPLRSRTCPPRLVPPVSHCFRDPCRCAGRSGVDLDDDAGRPRGIDSHAQSGRPLPPLGRGPWLRRRPQGDRDRAGARRLGTKGTADERARSLPRRRPQRQPHGLASLRCRRCDRSTYRGRRARVVAAEPAGLPDAASPAGRTEDAVSLRLSPGEHCQRTSRAFGMRRVPQDCHSLVGSPRLSPRR
jgi:hypothetical protein